MLKYSKAITLCANQIICFSQRALHPLHSMSLSITLTESSQLMQDSSTCSTWFYSVQYNCVLCCEVSSIKTGGIKAQGPFSNRKVHNFNEKSPHTDRIENIAEKTRENKVRTKNSLCFV